MRSLALLVGLFAAVTLATLGVDVSTSVSSSDFTCLKGQGYTFVMCVAPSPLRCTR